MFGRKKSSPYFFYPPGGIEQDQYNGYMMYGGDYREQQAPPYSLPFTPPQGNHNWYPNQIPYNMNPGLIHNSYPTMIGSNNAYAGLPNMMNHGFNHSILQNPLQFDENPYQTQYPQAMINQAGYNQYPNQALMPKQPGGLQTIMNSFKGQDGSIDINKMVNTAGQMMNAVSQVSSMIKGFGGMLK